MVSCLAPQILEVIEDGSRDARYRLGAAHAIPMKESDVWLLCK